MSRKKIIKKVGLTMMSLFPLLGLALFWAWTIESNDVRVIVSVLSGVPFGILWVLIWVTP